MRCQRVRWPIRVAAPRAAYCSGRRRVHGPADGAAADEAARVVRRRDRLVGDARGAGGEPDEGGSRGLRLHRAGARDEVGDVGHRVGELARGGEGGEVVPREAHGTTLCPRPPGWLGDRVPLPQIPPGLAAQRVLGEDWAALAGRAAASGVGPARRVGAHPGGDVAARLLLAGAARGRRRRPGGRAQDLLRRRRRVRARGPGAAAVGGGGRRTAPAGRPAPPGPAPGLAARRRPPATRGTSRRARSSAVSTAGCTCPRCRSCGRWRRTSRAGSPTWPTWGVTCPSRGATSSRRCRWGATWWRRRRRGRGGARRPPLRQRAGRRRGPLGRDRPQADERRPALRAGAHALEPDGRARGIERVGPRRPAAPLPHPRGRRPVSTRTGPATGSSCGWSSTPAGRCRTRAAPAGPSPATNGTGSRAASRSPRPSRTEARALQRWQVRWAIQLGGVRYPSVNRVI